MSYSRLKMFCYWKNPASVCENLSTQFYNESVKNVAQLEKNEKSKKITYLNILHPTFALQEYRLKFMLIRV